MKKFDLVISYLFATLSLVSFLFLIYYSYHATTYPDELNRVYYIDSITNSWKLGYLGHLLLYSSFSLIMLFITLFSLKRKDSKWLLLIKYLMILVAVGFVGIKFFNGH